MSSDWICNFLHQLPRSLQQPSEWSGFLELANLGVQCKLSGRHPAKGRQNQDTTVTVAQSLTRNGKEGGPSSTYSSLKMHPAPHISSNHCLISWLFFRAKHLKRVVPTYFLHFFIVYHLKIFLFSVKKRDSPSIDSSPNV